MCLKVDAGGGGFGCGVRYRPWGWVGGGWDTGCVWEGWEGAVGVCGGVLDFGSE